MFLAAHMAAMRQMLANSTYSTVKDMCSNPDRGPTSYIHEKHVINN